MSPKSCAVLVQSHAPSRCPRRANAARLASHWRCEKGALRGWREDLRGTRVREMLASSTPSVRCGFCARDPFLSERVRFSLRLNSQLHAVSAWDFLLHSIFLRLNLRRLCATTLSEMMSACAGPSADSGSFGLNAQLPAGSPASVPTQRSAWRSFEHCPEGCGQVKSFFFCFEKVVTCGVLFRGASWCRSSSSLSAPALLSQAL